MPRPEAKTIANCQDDYATPADFCNVLESDMKCLYLLAFLLTANHKDAERCFMATVEGAFKEQGVFKGWARTWVKRNLIKNAIQISSPISGGGAGKGNPWSVERQTPGDDEINAVTQLAPLERFIFVMSILERYSAWDCSVLLGCDMKKVAQVRREALRGLTGRDAVLLIAETALTRLLQVTA